DKCAGADVLQTNRVQHARRGLKQSWWWVAHHRLAREAFRDKSAQLLQGDHVFELDAVSKGSTGGNDRVLESNTAEVDAQIRLARGNRFRSGGSHETYSVNGGSKFGRASSPPKRMKIPRGSGAQAPSPAFGRGFCKVVSRESFVRSRGRLRSLGCLQGIFDRA